MITGGNEILVNGKTVTLPSFFIDRTIHSRILDVVNSEDIVFIVGKRVSGKTYVLHSVARSLRNKNVYFFPSNISIDSDFIDKLKTLRNSTIIFDTDTITSYDVEDIYYQISDFTANNINFIFGINSSDRLMYSIPYTRVIDREIIEISPIFNLQERTSFNSKVSEFGFFNLDSSQSIINNVLKYKEAYSNYNKEIGDVVDILEGKTLDFFILSAIFDKVYSKIYRALKIDYDKISFAIKHSNRSIELEYDLENLEIGQHSNYKTVTNSKSFIFACLGQFIEKSKNVLIAVKAIVGMVEELRKYEIFENQYKALISFDTLNQIFHKRKGSGAISLIFHIYEDLQKSLFLDSHYWMQRAKSIYYMKKNDITELRTAINYALKPYNDSISKPQSRLHLNAGFQIASIYIRIAKLENFSNSDTIVDAAKWLFKSLQEENKNRVVKEYVEDARLYQTKNDLYNFASHILHNKKAIPREHAELIISNIFDRFR